jgi:hypothetical protein
MQDTIWLEWLHRHSPEFSLRSDPRRWRPRRLPLDFHHWGDPDVPRGPSLLRLSARFLWLWMQVDFQHEVPQPCRVYINVRSYVLQASACLCLGRSTFSLFSIYLLIDYYRRFPSLPPSFCFPC